MCAFVSIPGCLCVCECECVGVSVCESDRGSYVTAALQR